MTEPQDQAQTSTGSPGEAASAAPAEGAVAPLPPLVEADSPGRRLRAAREALGQSTQDIATRLRMGVRQVQALEAADYSALPTGTFLRGFVRNYAVAVGLDAKEVLELLERTHVGARVVSATQVVEPARQKMNVREPAGALGAPAARTLVGLVVLACLAAAAWYWWQFIRPNPNPSAATKGATVAVAAPVAQPFAEPMTQPVPSAPTESNPVTALPDVTPSVSQTPVAPISEPPPRASVPAAPVTSPSPAATAPVSAPARGETVVEPDRKPRVAGSSLVGFTFSGESWVEVADANGRVLLSKRFRAGDADEVSGKGPLSITIGNASVTRMAVNGREFDLAPHVRGAVARVSAK